MTAVVLTRDEREDLERSLDALRRSEIRGGLAVVVVDNGSTDGTAAALAARPDVVVRRSETNLGVAGGRNLGLAAARGRHVAFLDSDTLVEPRTLGCLAGALDADPSLGMVGPRLVYPDGGLQLSARRVPSFRAVVLNRVGGLLPGGPPRPVRRYLMMDAPHDRRMDVDYVLGAAMVVRVAALREAGGFDEEVTRTGFGFDDLQLALALCERGWRVGYVPDAVAVHGYRRRLAGRPVSRGTLDLARSLRHVRRAHRARPSAVRPPGPVTTPPGPS